MWIEEVLETFYNSKLFQLNRKHLNLIYQFSYCRFRCWVYTMSPNNIHWPFCFRCCRPCSWAQPCPRWSQKCFWRTPGRSMDRWGWRGGRVPRPPPSGPWSTLPAQLRQTRSGLPHGMGFTVTVIFGLLFITFTFLFN